MKIPIYRRQTPLPTKTSGQYLGSSADPGKFGMAAGAYASLGVNVMNEGLNWFGTQLKQVRATKVATADAEFSTYLTQAAHNSKYQNVQSNYWKNEAGETLGLHDQRTRVEQSLLAQAQAQASNISDPVVRRRFLTNTTSSVASAMPQIMTNLTTSWQQYSEGEWDKTSKVEVFRIAQIENDETRELNVAKRLKEIADYGMANVWDANDINKEQQSFLEDIDVYGIGRRVSDAVEAGEPDDLEILLKELRTGVNELNEPVYTNLSLDRRDKTITRIEAKADRLVTAAHNAAMKKEKEAELAVNRAQEQTFETMSSQIDKGRAWMLENPGQPLPPGMEIPTVLNLLELDARQLKPGDLDILREKIEGNDVINNPQAVHEFNERITNAFTEQDLNHLEKEVHRQYQNRIIGGKAYGVLTQNIKSARGGTPRGKQNKLLRSNLQTVFGHTPGGIRLRGASTPDRDIQLQSALMMYDRMVGDGVRPAEAFYETVNTHLQIPNNEKKFATGEVLNLGSDMWEVLGVKDIRSENFIDRISVEHVENATRRWRMLASGRLPSEVRKLEQEKGVDQTWKQLSPSDVRALGLDTEQRIGVRDLYQMENSLQYLSRYVDRHNRHVQFNTQVEPPPPEETKPDADGDQVQTPESVDADNEWTDDAIALIKRILSGDGEESAADSAASRGAGAN